MSDDHQEMLADFVDEAASSLHGLPPLLDAHRQQPQSPDAINAVFRAVHSIKGCAGFLNLPAVKVFSHALENTLDEIRKGKVALTEPLQRDFVQGFDYIEEMLQASLAGQIQGELQPREQELLDRIAAIAPTAAVDAAPEVELLVAVESLAAEMAQALAPDPSAWAARAQALVDNYRMALEAGGDGEEGGETAAPQRSPQTVLQARYAHGEVDLHPHVAAAVQLFVTIESEPYRDEHGEQFAVAIAALCEHAGSLGAAAAVEALRKAEKDFQTIVNSPLDVDKDVLSIVWDGLWPGLAELETKEAAPAAEEKPAAVDAGESAGGGTAKSRMVRIKEDRLDEFLEHVSSLFITGELLKDLQARMSDAKQLGPLVEEMRQINATLRNQSTSLQQSVVSLRKVAISGLLSKFPRMARGLAQQLNKRVDVHLSGEDTEVDKTLAEDLDAPLTHMVRNVVDHAIEPPEQREARGVDPVGNLWLHAEQTRSHVRVIVRDDGRGIDPARLRAKAVEKELLTQAQADALSDEDAVDLIFHAGFSTAEKISDVSGRGVGMDVVRTTLREHGGDVQVESKVNVGTTFTLEIPIRNAVLVIDGLMLGQSRQNFVLPFEHILEITEVDAAELSGVHGARMARIRNETYDAISLASILNLEPCAVADSTRIPAVVVGCKQGSICLLVDQVFGHRQVVVNSLHEILPGHDRIAGVAQLGGGRLALVLSVPDIVKNLNRPKTAV